MSSTLIDEAKLKEALKSAIVEILEERKDLVREVLEEALEDIALAHAIERRTERTYCSYRSFQRAAA